MMSSSVRAMPDDRNRPSMQLRRYRSSVSLTTSSDLKAGARHVAGAAANAIGAVVDAEIGQQHFEQRDAAGRPAGRRGRCRPRWSSRVRRRGRCVSGQLEDAQDASYLAASAKISNFCKVLRANSHSNSSRFVLLAVSVPSRKTELGRPRFREEAGTCGGAGDGRRRSATRRNIGGANAHMSTGKAASAAQCTLASGFRLRGVLRIIFDGCAASP